VTKIISIQIAFVTLILLSTTASSVITAHAQTNATSANQTGKTSSSAAAAQSEQASRSIRCNN